MNKQTRAYRQIGVSVTNCGDHPGFKEFPLSSQPSKRKQPWKGHKNDSRTIIYPAEFGNRTKK